MGMTNEELAFSILRHDRSARKWIFNHYCSNCSRFLHIEDITGGKCRKCGTSTTTAIGQPIPFLTSATAIEKLLVWLRIQAAVSKKARTLADDTERLPFRLVLLAARTEINRWIDGDSTELAYHQAMIDVVGRALDNIKISN